MPLAIRITFAMAALAAAVSAQDGKVIFRSNCAFCHGITGTGGRGPSLVSPRITQSTSDAVLKTIIREGIGGMPAFFRIEDDDLARLITFIRSLGRPDAEPYAVSGDANHGAEIYRKSGCSSCHRIGETGSLFGPDLTRIGAARTPEYIRQSVVDPSADIPAEYEGVTAVTKNGKRVTGIRINEDTFSIQIRLPDETFALFRKSQLTGVINEARSLMPSYDRLSAGDLQDLLAYLDAQRRPVTAQSGTGKSEGLK
jgi:cytochrome c oxidase cbb3-type subunit III